MWSKPCKRPGCAGKARAEYCSFLAAKAYCSTACRKLDASRAATHRAASEYIPCPDNNIHHRKVRDRQLELIRQEIARIRAARQVSDVA